ncbi:MAG: sporulation protein YqfD [Clostridia bacterium]|nr:sporulation protein YqfD [Clostridia bacterium]
MTLRGFLQGTLEVQAVGNVEVFLSHAAREELYFSLPTRLDDLTLRFSVSPKSYKKLRLPARRAGVRLHLLRKRGLPFLLRPLRHRFGLWAGLFAVLLLLILSTAFLWTVEVEGVSPATSSLIRETLSDHGLRPGSLQNRQDAEHLRRMLLMEIDCLDFAAVNLYGSRAVVVATEAAPLPESEYPEISTPADLVACKDGYLLETRIHRGEQLIFPGSAVRAGEIIASHLVHGIVPGTKEFSGTVRYEHAHGVVLARTYGQISMVMPKDLLQKVHDGREFTQNRFFFAERPIFFSSGYGNSTLECDKIEERLDLSLPGGNLLPIARRTVTHRPYQLIPGTVSREEALVCMGSYLKEYLVSSATDGLLEEFQATLTEEDSLWRLDAEYFMTEDIGKVVTLTLTP